MKTDFNALFGLGGRVALVTGASRGLGRRFATVLAGAGASVGLVARDRARLEEVRRGIEEAGGRATVATMDVTDPASIAAGMDAVETALGPVSILVNNAGIASLRPVLEVTAEDWTSVIDTNLNGAFHVAQAMARRMAARGGGRIINISSVLGERATKGLAAYCAAKAGLSHLTHAMALELARDGIQVNAIAPGYIETDINRDFFQTPAGERLVKGIPLRRVGQEGDLDGVLLLLASNAGAYITGSVVVVDGGFAHA